MTKLIVDHPGCRIWRASEALMKLLPAEQDAAEHWPLRSTSSVDSRNHKGFSYVTCSSGVWHVDGFDMMTFVVVKGSMTLQVSHLTGDERFAYGKGDIEWLDVEAEHQLVRGDVLVLWGLHAHRVIGKGTLSLINVDCAIPVKTWLNLKENFRPNNRDLPMPKLYSPRFAERILMSHLKNPVVSTERKQLWEKYSAVLNGR